MSDSSKNIEPSNTAVAEVIEIPIDASRVCDAIARIGYSAASAIMDIVDNSVTWNATKVRLCIALQDGKTYSDRRNIDSVTVIDNGNGMDEEGVKNALKLGSPSNYTANSLSKYGMGLKAAGFSLGNRITILSKTQGVVTRQLHVDKTEIAQAGRYIVSAGEPEADLLTLLNSVVGSTGTLVRISTCNATNHDSARKTIEQLQEELGVTYFSFLSREHNPITISVECTNKPTIEIMPKDILFLSDAYAGFNKDTYDCKKPCKVLDVPLPLEEGAADQPQLTVVLFPQDQLSRCPDFTEDERKRIKDYAVSRRNKGFFVYRNDRLIRWGDNLSGLIGKDDLLIRARLSIRTSHDDTLHVDVSKQRLFVPEEILKKIEHLIQIPLRHCDDIKGLCKELMKGDEGDEFNERNKDLPVEEDEPVVGEQAKSEVRKRKSSVVEKTKKTLEAAGESVPPVTPDQTVTQIPTFERVRYSDKVASVMLWEMGEDPTDGVFVRINKNHSFYQTVLSTLSENSAERQAIEGLIWCAAVGENTALTKLTDLDASAIERVVAKFKRSFGINLDAWALNNQDLFEDGRI